jgi:trehalose 6-phosphate phosphatase
VTPWSVVLAGVSALAATPGLLLVVSDFDGTLAPISAEPMATRILPPGRAALRRLARLAEERPDRLGVVVLSGRTAADVATRVRVGGVRYLGNHGIEGAALARRARAEGLVVTGDPALVHHVAGVRHMADAVVQRLGRPDWLFVEEKGPTVAFHFRRAADGDAARDALLAAIDDAETATGGLGLARLEGRRVVELRPEGAGHKGAAVERLIAAEHPAGVIVLGDDRSDAPALRALVVARNGGRLQCAMAAAVHGGGETPAEIIAAADVVLGGPRDAARALSHLAGLLEREDRVSPGGASPLA